MAMFESFRAVRWLRTLNLVLQAVLVLTFFGGLNYVARNYSWGRFDLTKQRQFSLSPETLSYIKNLRTSVHVVIALGENTDAPEIGGLIDEYVYATADRAVGRITKETLDIYQQRRRAEELGIMYNDVVVLISGEKRRVIPISELYAVKNKEREAFQGEKELTAGILDVAEPQRKKIYFIVGHEELRPEDTDAVRGLSQLAGNLKLRNFDVEAVDLSVTRRVPADAALLISVAPQSRFSPAEQEAVRRYLGNEAGRLILFVGPGLSATALGLDDVLFDWGVLLQDDLICDVSAENVTETQDLVIRAFLPHPITKTLLDHQGKLTLGLARTVMPDPGRTTSTGLQTVTVAATSTTAWGEKDYRSGTVPRLNPGIDTRPIPGLDPPDRLGVVVAAERLGVRENLPFSVRGGKLVVFGTGDLVSNDRIDSPNLHICLNAINWCVDRDRQLNIAPRPIERFQLSLSAAEFTRLRYSLLLGLPGAMLMLGLLVYWARRR